MKHFVLLSLLVLIVAAVSAQVTYRTAISGNFTAAGTWTGGAAGAPPTSGVCNCKIVVSSNTTLTIDQNITLQNAAFVLDGPNSVLTFLPNIDLVLTGANSSIDIQHTTARIVRGNANNDITLGGQVIYDGNSTRFNSTTNGTVNGLASASAARANPQFQSGTLPVTLSEFKVTSKGSSVALSWKTELEVNSSHFDVQRSSDSKEWSTIGTVSAAGNVSVEQSYSFNDASPANGTNYYRLKIVDIDAKFEYSPIKSVSFTSNALTVLSSPNPASSMLNVSISQPGTEPFRLRLINRSGQVVYDQKHPAASSRITLNVSTFAEGSYFLETTNTTGLRQINKVMIVHK